ncbi:MAG TPA: histidine kinase N-terminal 7TM domain-containing protein [Anaerolineaceae bacterium]
MQINPLALLQLLPFSINLVLILLAWKRRENPAARTFVFLMAAMAWYSLMYGFELASASFEWKKTWLRLEYFGINSIPLFLGLFILQFTRMEKWIKPSTIVFLTLVPLLSLIINFTNEYHSLFYSSITLNTSGIFPLLSLPKGPWYWVYSIHLYLVFIFSSYLLIRRYQMSSGMYRDHNRLVLIGMLVPILVFTVYLFRIPGIQDYDLNPIFNAISGGIMGWGLLQTRLLDPLPIARSALIETMQDGILVFDRLQEIIDINPAAVRILRHPKTPYPGTRLREVVSSCPEMVKFCENPGDGQRVFKVDDYWLDVHSRTLFGKDGETVGRLVVLRDITNLMKTEEELHSLFESLKDIVVVFNREGRYIQIAPSRISRLMRPPEKVLGKTVFELFDKESAEMYVKYIQQSLDQNRTLEVEYPLTYEGHSYWYSSTVTPMNSDQVIWIARDITERKQAEVALRKAKEASEAANAELLYSMLRMEHLNRFSRALSGMLQVDAIIDQTTRQSVELLEAASCQIFLREFGEEDFTLTEISSTIETSAEIYPGDIPFDRLREYAGMALNKGRSVYIGDHGLVESAGRGFTTLNGPRAVVIPLLSSESRLGVLAIVAYPNRRFNDSDLLVADSIGRLVSSAVQNAHLFNQLQTFAQTDSLTNLYSRRHFYALSEHEYVYSLRYHHPLSVMMLDIDNFKQVNDTYGHPLGDIVLREIGRVIIQNLRTVDIAGRYGGEEIVILLPSTRMIEAGIAAERIRKEVEKILIPVTNGFIQVTISIGVTELNPAGDDSLERMVQRADQALYHAKNSGKNQVAYVM